MPTSSVPPAVRFTLDEAQAAADAWKFNCGPASLAAVLELTPEQVRPLMGDFESKGYTNPTLMHQALAKSGRRWTERYRADIPAMMPRYQLGLVRVQVGGPWTKPGVPFAARYRYTHWVGVAGNMVFDVNAMCVGGWLRLDEWDLRLMPWLIRECYPRADGTCWPTHGIEVFRV